MRRGIFVLIATTLLGVALVQESGGQGGSLEIQTQPAGALVSISGPEGFVSMFEVSGSEVLRGLPAGRYLVVAAAHGHAAGQAEIELGEGAQESVSIELEQVAGRQQAGQPDQGQQQAGQQQAGQQQAGQQQAGQQQVQQPQDQQGQQQAGHQQAQAGQQQAQQPQQQDQQASGQAAGGGQAGGQQGGQVYSQQCAQCHGQQGEGGTGPALAGNQNLQDAQMVVSQIVQGGGGMPAFGNQLSDEQIAAVATHEMNSWGNSFGQVSADQVSQVRGGGQAPQQQQQQQGQQAQQQPQQPGQQQPGQQAQQQAQQPQQPGQQQPGQQAQQPQQQGQQSGMQAGQGARVEITVPTAGQPITIVVEVPGAGAMGSGMMGQQGGQQAQQQPGQQMGQQLGQQQQPQPQQQQQPQQQPQQQQPQQQQAQQQPQQPEQQEESGDPARQGVLQINWVEPSGATVTVTGPDGFFRQMQLIGGTVLDALDPGSYSVTAVLQGYESATEEVEVEAQQTANVSLNLQRQAGQQQQQPEQPGDPQQDDPQQEGQQPQQQGQQQPPQQQGQQQPPQQAGQQVAGGGQAQQQGEQTYSQQCAQCHGQQGEGVSAPPLAGNQNLQDVQAVVNQILNGGGGMPAFGNQLSDEEIAGVATHEMNSWGNGFGQVTPEQVAQQRGGGQQQAGQQGQQQQQQQQQQAGQQGQQQQQQPGQQQSGQQQAQPSAAGQQQGWFTSEQARRGMQEYSSHCAVCHGGGLQGRASYPPVAGDDFLAEWQGRTAEELFEYISTEMPQDRPGALGHLTYTYLTAYILDQNGFPVGETELAPESGRLAQLLLQPTGAGGGQQEGQPPAPVGQETQQPEQDAQ